jgi:predicted cupin superfamily sugar epimerase
MTAEEIIQLLDLKPLPSEGGYYRETFRSTLQVRAGSPPYTRLASTAIYYLVTPDDFSALHRVKHDEVFHFYAGDPVEMVQFESKSECKIFTLGKDLLKGQKPQIVVPALTWQGCRLIEEGRWALLGCTVAPGFQFEDFELGSRELLTQEFPKLREIIQKYTRG